jgi:hypothetical protein
VGVDNLVVTILRWCAVCVVLLGGVVMVLFDLGSWAWNGMNLASSLYLLITVAV